MELMEKIMKELRDADGAEIDRLRALNAELVAALELSQTGLKLAMSATTNDIARTTYQTAYAQARAVLAKAKGTP